jgi:hypothetical protein
VPDYLSPRHALPLLAVAQAGKELTHNEALVAIDALLHAEVVGERDDPPGSPERVAGACWIVGAGAVGDWTGQSRALALWTDGGWRYLAPRRGMTVTQGDGRQRRFDGVAWLQPGSAIPPPAGGAVIDSEARAALAAIVSALNSFGLVG